MPKMIIELEDLKNLARLAKIHLEPDAEENSKTDLNRIMQMIAEMQSVDTSDIQPMANPLDAVQRLRLDKVTESDHREEFLSLTDHAQHGFYTVPRVIE
ncbi:MAG: Asp-tRNA(Asn)/Glu-tRNA(Gln) amidotransferase subunit GatC [Pseudomonadales bacterium]|nr:Asp-tRNA(Asn)/Glu-tRNA(Gln) amidotransferase subunit GatC [Pseudomonadales bacterium]